MNKTYEALGSPTPQESSPGYFLTSPSVKDPEGGHAPQNRHTVETVTFIDYHVFEKWAASASMKRGEEYKAFKEKIGEGLF